MVGKLSASPSRSSPEAVALHHLYSFDDDFDGIEGITRLATPDNPFN